MFQKSLAKPNKILLLGGLVIFFCLLLKDLYAGDAKPAIGELTPATGVSSPCEEATFNISFSDADGWQDIRYIRCVVNESLRLRNGLYILYLRENNKLYLRDGLTNERKSCTPGDVTSIENFLVKIDFDSSGISTGGDTLTVKVNLSFKEAFLGEKKIYLQVSDYSGNNTGWINAGNWGISNPPQLQEGRIISPDGQSEIIIPEGALNQSLPIKITTLDTEILQRAAPEDRDVLGAVECKPDNITFNKPVTLITKLPQAQIPGTPVEIGLYNAPRRRIETTGQKSNISSDGYSVSFQVSHFSTYAILNGFVSQGAPIGAGVKVPLPDMLTGAFSHSIPLTIPPGRKGMQPALSLNYRSSNPNSWVGYGFSLNPGYIVRSTRLGPPTYIDTQDTYYFITNAGTTELVHLIDNLYQAKVESAFTRFYKEADNSWKVINKDGTTLEFGKTDDSKETSNSGAFSWYITKASDTNGNYISYSYTKDKERGKSYLSRIDYTGHENSAGPAHSIEFFLEGQDRDDVISSYISGSKIVTAKRLEKIEVRTKGDLVWSYKLEYAYSDDTNRSLLKSITQYGSNNKSLPKQTFTYQQAK